MEQKLRRLEQTVPPGAAEPPPGAGKTPAAAQQAQNVAKAAAWLATHGLPAPAWQPDPAWLAAKLPVPQLDPGAMATLSALGTLRAQSQQAFGLDPLQPGQATPLARVVTTLNARLAALASGPPLPDPAPWHRLADESAAADAVQQAAKSGLLAPSPEQIEAYSQPAGRPMQQWLPLLRQVRALGPLIAAAKQLEQPQDASQAQQTPQTLTQRLADAVRKLRSVALPPLAEPAQAARLMSLLSASGRLRQSLGIDPAEAGYAEVQQAVAAKTAVAAAILRRQQQAPPANLPYCPSLIAPPAVVQAAGSDSVRELAAINWKVPPVTALPVVQSGLSASTLAKQMAAALGASPVRPGPCGQGCDAAKIMRAAA